MSFCWRTSARRKKESLRQGLEGLSRLADPRTNRIDCCIRVRSLHWSWFSTKLGRQLAGSDFSSSTFYMHIFEGASSDMSSSGCVFSVIMRPGISQHT